MIHRLLPLALILLLSYPVIAQNAITYQARLDEAGAPADGSYDFMFRLFSAASAGSQIGSTQVINDLPVTKGLFAVSLDFGAGAFDGGSRWLQVEVRPGAATGAYTILTPRQRITPTPYAIYALNTPPMPAQLWSASGAHITNTNAGRVGVGTSDPEAPLHVFAGSAGSVTAHANSIAAFERGGAGYLSILTPTNTERGILFADPSSTTSGGIIYNHPVTPNGLQFRTAFNSTRMLITAGGHVGVGTTEPAGRLHVVTPTGNAVMGHSTATTGLNAGLFGQSDSDSGIGVFGAAPAALGETYGGYFMSNSDFGHGLFATAAAPVGDTIAGKFVADSMQGTAVVAWATAEDGQAYGVVGSSAATFGTGVYGDALDTGVYGAAFGPSPNFGVLGWVPGQIGYGVYAQGRLGASGTKSFRIDHPEAPTEKYLIHYATEGPEVINFYRGKVTLDERGEATVELPAYFARINASPSYQLTPIGSPMPNLHVAKPISEHALRIGADAQPGSPVPTCTFTIAGGAPGGEVSWRVEAVRNDLWTRRAGAPVEVLKPERERGTYQHPDLYGLPENLGVLAPRSIFRRVQHAGVAQEP